MSGSQDYSSYTSLHTEDDELFLPVSRGRQWLRRLWAAHIIVSICIMSMGIAHNKTSKYVPISPEKAGTQCERAFLNVLATSEKLKDAIVCCSDGNANAMSLCPAETSFLPLANRLARWPDAWILPLFPLSLRILFTFGRELCSQRRSNIYQSTSWLSFTAAIRRLGYYIILLNVRGWVLYVGLNAVEDMIVRPVDSTTCWYRDWLRTDQPQCFGRVFDFSDHIVLYYAQILPLSLFECLHSLEYPYWFRPTNRRSLELHQWSSRLTSFLAAVAERLVPLIICSGMIYLYFITCLGVYKTALYFHTGWEVVVGFVVSQAIHLPLCFIQCSDQLEPLREFLFATNSNTSNTAMTKYKSLS